MTAKRSSAKRTLHTVVREDHPQTGRLRIDPGAYAAKFTRLLDALNAPITDADGEPGLLVSHPTVLGDDYDELIQTLSLLAETGFSLLIAGPQPGALQLARLNRVRPKPPASPGAGKRKGA